MKSKEKSYEDFAVLLDMSASMCGWKAWTIHTRCYAAVVICTTCMHLAAAFCSELGSLLLIW